MDNGSQDSGLGNNSIVITEKQNNSFHNNAGATATRFYNPKQYNNMNQTQALFMPNVRKIGAAHLKLNSNGGNIMSNNTGVFQNNFLNTKGSP